MSFINGAWTINGEKFKIEQYAHTVEELAKTAEENWFHTGIMPLRDVCDSNNITGHLLVCEKK